MGTAYLRTVNVGSPLLSSSSLSPPHFSFCFSFLFFCEVPSIGDAHRGGGRRRRPPSAHPQSLALGRKREKRKQRTTRLSERVSDKVCLTWSTRSYIRGLQYLHIYVWSPVYVYTYMHTYMYTFECVYYDSYTISPQVDTGVDLRFRNLTSKISKIAGNRLVI